MSYGGSGFKQSLSKPSSESDRFQPKKLERHKVQHHAECANVVADFSLYEADPKLHQDYVARPVWDKVISDVIKPARTMPDAPTLPQDLERLIKQCWKKSARPRTYRGFRQIGTHRPDMDFDYQPYVKEVAPIVAGPGDPGIARDWSFMKEIQRMSAYTFRGDRRGPNVVLGMGCGLHPPSTRTDRAYLEGPIYNCFNDYLERRYQRQISQQEFLGAVDQTVTTPEVQRAMIDYTLWRSLLKREEAHLGRMSLDECLKGYISTTRHVGNALYFASGRDQIKGPGWVYVTLVRHGWVIPNHLVTAEMDHKYVTTEQEIAQFGSIPVADIVAFRHTQNGDTMDGPVYIRRQFQYQGEKGEWHAFQRIYELLSGKKQPP